MKSNELEQMKGFAQKQSVVIVAGGKGLRAGGELPKQFCEIGGKPMLIHTIEAFRRFDDRMLIVLVLPEMHLSLWEKIRQEYCFETPVTLAIGGETRFHSVKSGLENVPDDCIVGVHDAARPFVSQRIIEESYRVARKFRCGAIPVIGEKNSIRLASKDGSEPIDRSRIKIVQTPQVFPAKLLKDAYRVDYRADFTDDASVAEKAGIRLQLIEGDELNFKITTPLDMDIGRLIFRKSAK
ncbi:MAG: 2-C-methyl-D-erythritol 4-phosphate cytidylyltransferase [Dysgonamonadaceae bacterium]|jgi:2-C-methyl-D-erythritol 4-phosphate cytidylyltransferase|nr:2-C-methyl-D-erythritol 4-phosphate cytidylyltransferase [Dysgonamonadaceae bacterium]